MKRAALVGLTAAVLAALGFALLLTIAARDCPSEDSQLCTWYTSSGNGQGRSFTDFGPLGVAYWTK